MGVAIPTSYTTERGPANELAKAFAAGCGGRVEHVYDYEPGPLFVHGLLRGGWWLLEQAVAAGDPFWFGDNAYLKAPHLEPHYRVTRDRLQHPGLGMAGPERWRRFKLKIEPWRETGGHVLVIPPPRIMGLMLDFSADEWLRDTVAELKQHTDRPIRVRDRMAWKALKTMQFFTPLSEDLKGAWALVARTSNAAVEALLAGVPVFCTHPCAAYWMGQPDLREIEKPFMPEEARERWAWNLAANQWTLDEIRSGQCWKEIGG